MHVLRVRVTSWCWWLCSLAHRSEERESAKPLEWARLRWDWASGLASVHCWALGSHSSLQLESRGLKISKDSVSQTWVGVRIWGASEVTGLWCLAWEVPIQPAGDEAWEFAFQTSSQVRPGLTQCSLFMGEYTKDQGEVLICERLHPHQPREPAFVFWALALSLNLALQPFYLLHRSLTLIWRGGSSFWSWRQEWSACLPTGNFYAFIQRNSLHAWEKGKGLWKCHSLLLLVKGEEKPGRWGALQKGAWLSETVMSFQRLEFFP